MGLWVICFAAAGQDNGAHMECHVFGLISKSNGAGGAKFFTGPAFAFGQVYALSGINDVFQRNGLSILDINGLAVAQGAVIFIFNFFGALLRTQPAGDTFIHIHITGILRQRYLKVAFFTGNIFHFRQRQQLNIDVPADLDQFR